MIDLLDQPRMIDGSFAAAKKRDLQSEKPKAARYEADGGGRRPGYFSRRLPLFGFTGGSGLFLATLA